MRYTGLLLIMIPLLISCNRGSGLLENEAVGYAQGTTYQIKYLSKQPLDLQPAFDSIFRAIDQSMSTYQDNSLISRVNRGDSNVLLDEHFRAVMQRSLEVARETQGAFDPTVGPLVRSWGFGESGPQQRLDQASIDSLRQFVGYEDVALRGSDLRIPEGFRIDFNAIAQGYTVDVISSFLERKGFTDYMVEVGGEVKARGNNVDNKTWLIGIDKPTDSLDQRDRFQVILSLKNRSLATSGNYRKFWTDEETGMRYAHTIDPATGKPARNKLLSVSVLADNCTDADAYATACMVMGTEKAWEFLLSKPKLDAYLVVAGEDDQWQIKITEGFREQIVANP